LYDPKPGPYPFHRYGFFRNTKSSSEAAAFICSVQPHLFKPFTIDNKRSGLKTEGRSVHSFATGAGPQAVTTMMQADLMREDASSFSILRISVRNSTSS
jgi:hypothetical protein